MKKNIESKVKLKVELKSRDSISVNVPTLENLKTLMGIYELAGGITWVNGDPPIPLNFAAFFLWTITSEDTYIILENNKISLADTSYFHNSFSFKGYCNSIGLNEEKLKEINNYFSK